jgi:plastocyanin
MRPARYLATYPLLVLIAFAALSWGDAGSEARTVEAQETVAIAVGDFFFCDPSLPPGGCQTVVSVGDTVTWEYRTGSEGHTVTHCGDSCDAPTDSPLWDSELSPGQAFSHTFSEPGAYQYLCRFHPEAMRAVVLVEATPPPATPTQTVGPPTASPTSEPSLRPTASPASQPSPSPTPSLGAEDDAGGISSWVVILAGVGGVVVLGAGVLALRRFR